MKFPILPNFDRFVPLNGRQVNGCRRVAPVWKRVLRGVTKCGDQSRNNATAAVGASINRLGPSRSPSYHSFGNLGFYANTPARLDDIISSVVSIVQIPTKGTLKHIQRIQIFTIGWMSVEAALSLWAAWTARSPALAAFGGDSTIELLSAVVVLWRFRADASEHTERYAARIAGGLLVALACGRGCLCSIGFGDVTARGHRTKIQLLGDGGLGVRRACNAGSCQVETASFSFDRKCCSASRCCRICLVLLGVLRFMQAGTSQGRPVCSFGNHAADCARSSGCHARQGLWLLLATKPAHTAELSYRQAQLSNCRR